MSIQYSELKQKGVRDKSVLVAETEPFLRSILVDLLRAMGFSNILTASDMPRAISEIRNWCPDFLVLDWCLGDGSGKRDGGAKLMQWVRNSSQSPYREIPVIILTGDTSREAILAARDVGVDEIIIKPVVPKALFSRVAQVLRGKRNFVDTEAFTGPDRRRRSTSHFGGQHRRDADKSDDLCKGARNMSDSGHQLLIEMRSCLNSLDTSDRQAVMQVYHLAENIWEEAKRLGNLPMSRMGQSMFTYVQAIGNAGILDKQLLLDHLKVLDDMLSQSPKDRDPHLCIMEEVEKRVTATLSQRNRRSA